jgi:ABC-2 type transport system permease protein
MGATRYLHIWLASIRYSLVRTMMFRFDFLLWSAVELAWMAVNLLLIQVIYAHVDSIAGWGKYEMMLLVGTAMTIQRLLMGLFWSNLVEIGRNVRSGYFDFFLAQPGNPLFMVSTRKLDPDGLANSIVSIGVVAYAAHRLGLQPGWGDLAAYLFLLVCGLAIHYSAFLLIASTTFWIVKTEGVEGSYFTLFEFSRLPREAFRGLLLNALFVYALPAVVVSNFPAQTLLRGPDPGQLLWLGTATVVWLGLAIGVFNRGLRRYTSASS